MAATVIRVEGLGKKFHIGAQRDRYRTLRDRIAESMTAPVRRAARLLRGEATGAAELSETIWALKDVSFEVREGEVVGIIGRNGAGKSTLLKVLSRITEPTEGRAELRGRVSSLLEVGTGFHPELTGRENIYLNGAILGMRRAEIERKFDEIVAFAEVEKFIDTPVKHYSSGMYVRLAFAVAAHLEPEILVVDEVLSVGDAAFQRKCLGKMEEVAHGGRTILFVSHNMGAVDNLCTRGIWLDEGRIRVDADPGTAISAYLKGTAQGNGGSGRIQERRPTNGARIVAARLLDGAGSPCDTFLMGETVVLEFDVDFERRFDELHIALEVKRVDTGIHILHMVNDDCGFQVTQPGPGRRRFRVRMPNCLLYPASYKFSIYLGAGGRGDRLDNVEDIVEFNMVQSGVTKRTQRLSVHKEAVFFHPTEWEIE
jgi:lipopolysaccharide transport system ATP-binding protein